jgi:hypothetical protein
VLRGIAVLGVNGWWLRLTEFVRGAVAVHGGMGWWGLTIYEYENIYGFTNGVLGMHLLRFINIDHHEVDEQASGR